MKQQRLKVEELSSPEPSLGSEGVERVANSIEEDVLSRLDDNDIELIEAAGQLSLVELLRQHTLGKLTEKQAFKMLQDLVSKKTPNPIQRIEETQKIDIRVVFADILQSSPDVLERTLVMSRQRNEEVKQKLGLDSSMMLDSRANVVGDSRAVGGNPDQSAHEDDADQRGDQGSLPQPPLPLQEPTEISNIRVGGDGSRNRIEWETAIGRRPK